MYMNKCYIHASLLKTVSLYVYKHVCLYTEALQDDSQRLSCRLYQGIFEKLLSMARVKVGFGVWGFGVLCGLGTGLAARRHTLSLV